jgi:hypothetical protein
LVPGGHLAFITSDDEKAVIPQLMIMPSGKYCFYWLQKNMNDCFNIRFPQEWCSEMWAISAEDFAGYLPIQQVGP